MPAVPTIATTVQAQARAQVQARRVLRYSDRQYFKAILRDNYIKELKGRLIRTILIHLSL